jgi:hypothetical protein
VAEAAVLVVVAELAAVAATELALVGEAAVEEVVYS